MLSSVSEERGLPAFSLRSFNVIVVVVAVAPPHLIGLSLVLTVILLTLFHFPFGRVNIVVCIPSGIE